MLDDLSMTKALRLSMTQDRLYNIRAAREAGIVVIILDRLASITATRGDSLRLHLECDQALEDFIASWQPDAHKCQQFRDRYMLY